MLDMDKLKELIEKITPEEIEAWNKEYEKKNPRRKLPIGWIDIEEHLPYMLAIDFQTGTSYKVKLKDGSERYSTVGDHNVWYYQAKEHGVTHWWHDEDMP